MSYSEESDLLVDNNENEEIIFKVNNMTPPSSNISLLSSSDN